MYWHDVSWWGWLMMSVGMLVVYGLIVVGIALLLRWRGDTRVAGRARPEDILGERLVRGEIDAREYRQCVEALRSRGDRPRAPIS